MTSNFTCATGNPATSAEITMRVNQNLTPTVAIVKNPAGTICLGTPVAFMATPVNGGTIPSYQWQVNGINVGTNSPTLNSSTLTNGEIVAVIMTSNAVCPSPTTAASNLITMNVATMLTPAISITTATTRICAGTPVTFTATPINGGTTPVYQWQVNGVNAGTNSPAFTSSSLSNGDRVTVSMTSGLACASPLTATSNSVTMTVNPALTASVSITSPVSTICKGTIVTVMATPINGGSSPVYQWQLNGVNSGTNSPTYISATLLNGDMISVMMTSNMACVNSPQVSSNNFSVVIDPQKCPKEIFIPSGFTPNRDGKNDIFKPLIRGNIVQYKMSIYNRWGQKVFETTDWQKGWDGKVSGVDTDSNVFVWLCTFQFEGQVSEFRKGTVTVIR